MSGEVAPHGCKLLLRKLGAQKRPVGDDHQGLKLAVDRMNMRRIVVPEIQVQANPIELGDPRHALIMLSSAYAVNSIYSDLGKKDYPYTECPMTFSKDRARRPAPGTREQGPLCKRLPRLSAPRASLAKQVIGAASVEWHAKDSVARSFNKKYGFIQLGDDEDHLWLP